MKTQMRMWAAVSVALALGVLGWCGAAVADVPPDEFVDYRATWAGDPMGGQWMSYDPNNLGDPYWDPGAMDLVVPNLDRPDQVKRVWLEVDWRGPAPVEAPPIDLADPVPGVTPILPMLNPEGTGYTYGWVIDPQPQQERLVFPTPDFEGLVDVGIVTVATVCRPADQTHNIQKPQNLYGTLNQNVIPNIGAWACGPTAAVNSFVYLENAYPNHYGRMLVPDTDGEGDHDQAEMVAVAQTLANANHMNLTVGSGVFDDMFIYGKQKYMEGVAAGRTAYGAQLKATWGWPGARPPGQIPPIPKPAWVQDNTVPTWEFIFDNLVDCEDVEILLYNDTNEWGHFLTVTSFFWTDADGDGFIDAAENATIDYINPCGGVAGVSPIREIVTADPLNPTELQVWWNHPEYGAIPANVILAMKESVPEPAALFILAVGGLTLVSRRRRA